MFYKIGDLKSSLPVYGCINFGFFGCSREQLDIPNFENVLNSGILRSKVGYIRFG